MRAGSLILAGILLFAVGPRHVDAQKLGKPSSQTGSSTPSAYQPLYVEQHALVIGNSAYTDYDPLPGAATDAELAADAFRAAKFNVRVETNLTRDEMDLVLTEFFDEHGRSSTKRDNALVVYYAGHGERHNYSGWLVPVNAPGQPSESDEDAYMEWEDALFSVTELVAKTDKVKAKHILFILDGCYLGSIISPSSGESQYSLVRRDLMVNPSRYVLTSGDFDQRVSDASAYTHQLHQLLTNGTPPQGRSDEGPYWTGETLGTALRSINFGDRQDPQAGSFRQIRRNEGERGGIVFEASAFAPAMADAYDNRAVERNQRAITRICERAEASKSPLETEEMLVTFHGDDLAEELPYLSPRERSEVWSHWESCVGDLGLSNALTSRLFSDPDAGSGAATDE